MPKVSLNQTNFSAGELSPSMRGRTDVARYQNGADTIENGVVDVHGGVDRRDGTRFCAIAKLAGARKVRLVRYVFNEVQAYMLEFGHQYIRFFNVDGSVVLNAAGSAPLELASPYIESQLFDVTIKQGADTMFLFHKDVAPQRLRRVAAGVFTMQAVPWVVQPFGELGNQPAAQLSLSAITVGAGRTFTTGPTTIPGTPTIGTASPLNGGANVAFTAPASTGGLPITGYTVTSSPGGFTGTDTQSPVRVTGLTNGVSYTFTVIATNGIGNSASSAASNAIVPSSSLPSTAVNLTVTPVDFEKTVDNGTYSNLGGPTASASGSVPPFTYLWTRLSGATTLDVYAPGATSPRLLFNARGHSSTDYAIFRCTASDNYGGAAHFDINLTVNYIAPETGGGGATP